MAKLRKPETVAICINVPTRLMRRLNKMLADLRVQDEYKYISRSAFLSHAWAEWCLILDNPARLPESMETVRRRLRPEPRTRPNAMSKLTPAKVRAIRKDGRPFRKIARDLGVAATTVSRARTGATWGWVQ